MRKNKTVIIIIAAVLVAGIGFGAGMLAKSAIASNNTNIGMEAAKEIALASVGVSADKATFTKEEADSDSYEIDFYTESTEYDFEIDAKTGAIIDREANPRELTVDAAQASEEAVYQEESQAEAQAADNTATESTASAAESSAQSGDDSVIGVEAAKSIALKHAGLSSATFQKTSLDYDDGIRTYDVEFTAGDKEYEYEINAYSGKIIEYDIESRYDD